jgi:outer membrane receptor protein involved in Fe transport
MLKYRYKHIAKADIEVVYKKTSLGGSVRYNSFMKNIDKVFTADFIGGDNGSIPGINAARKKFKDGDFIVDLRAGYQVTKSARIGLIVNNLLNREYMSRPANMMPPRTIAMQLAVKI